MDERWKTSPGCVYNVSYHIIWCPKYRRKVLIGEVETRLKELLLERSKENGWEIKKMEVMPDHVHIFIKTTPLGFSCSCSFSTKRIHIVQASGRISSLEKENPHIVDSFVLCGIHWSYIRKDNP